MRFGGGNWHWRGQLALAHRRFLRWRKVLVVVAVVALRLARTFGKATAVACIVWAVVALVAEAGARPVLIVLTHRAVLSALVPVHVDGAQAGGFEVAINQFQAARVDHAGNGVCPARHIRASLRGKRRRRHIRVILEAREIDEFARSGVCVKVAHNGVQRGRFDLVMARVHAIGVGIVVTGDGRKAERGVDEREHRGRGSGVVIEDLGSTPTSGQFVHKHLALQPDWVDVIDS